MFNKIVLADNFNSSKGLHFDYMLPQSSSYCFFSFVLFEFVNALLQLTVYRPCLH